MSKVIVTDEPFLCLCKKREQQEKQNAWPLHGSIVEAPHTSNSRMRGIMRKTYLSRMILPDCRDMSFAIN